MNEPDFPFQTPRWTEEEASVARTYFTTTAGQHFLKTLRRRRPEVNAAHDKVDDRRTQLEKRLGYEDCFDTILRMVGPQLARSE